MSRKKTKPLIGWREWASMTELMVPLIKVKIDTGAKTSALHAQNIKIVKENNKEIAEFVIYPLQNNNKILKKSRAEIVDMRSVKSSNGQKQERLVIRTAVKIGEVTWDIDVTLTNRDIMHHRMLLGRDAMKDFLVDPSKSFCQGVMSSEEVKVLYETNVFI